MDAEEKIQHWIDGLANFNVSECIDQAVEPFRDEIVADNIIHLRRGERPDGTQITPSYEAWYARLKRYDDRMNMMDDPQRPFLAPNLAINGSAFYDTITLELTEDEIKVTSTSPMWEGYVPPMPGWFRSMTPLHEWYGEVLGISDTFMQAEIEPAIHESVTSTVRAIFD